MTFYLVGDSFRAYLDKLIKLLVLVQAFSATLFVSHYRPFIFFSLHVTFHRNTYDDTFFLVSGVSSPVQLVQIPGLLWLTRCEHAVSFSVLRSAC